MKAHLRQHNCFEIGNWNWNLGFNLSKCRDAPFYGAGQSPQRDFDGGYNKEWLINHLRRLK